MFPLDQQIAPKIESGKFRLLVLESDPQNRNQLREKLSHYPELEVEFPADYGALMEFLGQEHFDLLLLDLDHFEEDVVRVIREIKQIRNDQGFIPMTSSPNYEMVLMALKEGALDFFPRPLDDLAIARIFQTHRYRIFESRSASRIDRYIDHKSVRLLLPSDISLLPHVASRVTEEIYAAGVIRPRQIYNLNLALFECLTNALEHGNLNITYEQKTKHILKGDYLEMINEMCRKLPYCDRKILLEYSLGSDGVRINVEDEGDGFDVDTFLSDLNRKVNEDYHGRGLILILKTMDHVEFNKKGNRISIKLNHA